MYTRRALLASTATAMAIAGCLGGDDDGGGGDTPTDTPTETPTDTPMGSPTETATPVPDATVTVVEHQELGPILADADGMTLYMFDNDEQGAGESTCDDDCAANWPPLTTDADPTAGAEVTASLTTFEREDGTMQLAADGWPLYYWAADEEPGDATGQGVNDVWWVLRPDGTPVRPVDVNVATHPDLGDILVDGEGMTLYMFDNDEQGAGESTCYDDCAGNWPPLTVDDAPRAGDTVEASLDTFEREDGSMQVSAAGWPLYTWAADEEPGDATGQGVNDVWWVLDPAGEPRREGEDGTPSGPGY
ncbi:MAG: hypothetical protein ACOC0X_05965 [Halobacteriota archaeon]